MMNRIKEFLTTQGAAEIILSMTGAIIFSMLRGWGWALFFGVMVLLSLILYLVSPKGGK